MTPTSQRAGREKAAELIITDFAGTPLGETMVCYRPAGCAEIV